MNDYSKIIKERLTTIIRDMGDSPELFVTNPGKDFTRKRKLPLETVLQLLLSMGGNSLYNELLEYSGYDVNTATTSAFIQQREKILPFAFEFLLHEFTNTYDDIKLYRDYRLLAVDGSDLNIAHNPSDSDTYFGSVSNRKGFNQIHLNAMYDLRNKLYVDAHIQPGKKENEYRALTDMVDRSQITDKVILIADRGYESYNVFAHAEQKGWKYIVRSKDIFSNGIVSGLNFPNDDEFDMDIHLTLTRKQTKEVKSQPNTYKFMPSNSTFDFLDDETKFYPISFRVVRFKISETAYETIITNLERSLFSPKEMKDLYHMRWGIETSFRELKKVCYWTDFFSCKKDGVRCAGSICKTGYV